MRMMMRGTEHTDAHESLVGGVLDLIDVFVLVNLGVRPYDCIGLRAEFCERSGILI